MSERKLVTVRQVSEIKAIEGADNIEVAIVDGWQCVVKKGEFRVSELALYYEIDSFLPMSDKRYEFLSAKAITWEGKVGHVLRTMKLRKTLSQGLLLPLALFPELTTKKWYQFKAPNLIGKDFAEELSILKYEKEDPNPAPQGSSLWFLPKFLRVYVGKFYKGKTKARKAASTFPKYIPKTDEERVQNIIKKVAGITDEYEASVKMDGSSMTAWYRNEDGFGHASRNCKLGFGDGSHFTAMVERYNIKQALTLYGRDIAIQGEVCGPGIQAGYEQLEEKEFFVFKIYDIAEKRMLSPEERDQVLQDLHPLGAHLQTVPILGFMTLEKFKTIDDFLAFAEGPGYKNKKREGVVFKRRDGGHSFKVVANSYLLSER